MSPQPRATYPPSDLAEIARRLDVPTDVDTIALISQADTVARGILDPRTDAAKVDARPDVYLEAVYQLACKVWDTSRRGMVTTDALGDIDYSATATAGLYRSVLGVAQPVLTHGGVIVG